MLGKLLKDLFRALYQYVIFWLKRPFTRSPSDEVEGPIATSSPPDPFPKPVGATHDVHSSMPPAPPNTVKSIYHPKGPFEWQTLTSETQVYAGGPPIEALNLLLYEPKFLLDVGCSNGDFSSKVKQRFPLSTIWGVEPNQIAAKTAAGRIDRVLAKTIEEIDWSTEGVQRGDIDTVLLFDVLEHINDPWSTLLRLRNLVSGTAQIIVSIPNVRNILLLQDLIAGHWRYRRAGLLDITHIRFFTQKDMYRMFYQTGFRVVASVGTQDSGSMDFFKRYSAGKFPKTVSFDSASVTVHSMEDLASLCTLQHLFALQPAEHEELSPSERQWIESPHPATSAFGF